MFADINRINLHIWPKWIFIMIETHLHWRIYYSSLQRHLSGDLSVMCGTVRQCKQNLHGVCPSRHPRRPPLLITNDVCVWVRARFFFFHSSHDDRAVRGDNCMEIDRDASEYMIRGPSWKWSIRSYIGTTMQSKFFTLQVRQPLSHRYAILIDADIIYMFVIVYCAIYSVWKRHSEVSYNNSLL